MSDPFNQLPYPEESEEQKAAKAIAAKYTKPELVIKTLEAFQKISDILQLVAVALPDMTGATPIQKTLYETARAKEIREDAKAKLQNLVIVYNQSIEGEN